MRPTLLRGAMALVLLGLSIPAIADTRLEIEGGRSYSDSHGTNVGFVEALFDAHSFGSTRFTWAPDASVGFIDGRNLARYGNAVSDDVWLLAGGVRIRYGDSDDWYHHLFASFQPAAQGGRTQALSSGYEFVSTVGWQAEHFSLQIRHVSNGGLHGSNRGETMALVGLGFDL